MSADQIDDTLMIFDENDIDIIDEKKVQPKEGGKQARMIPPRPNRPLDRTSVPLPIRSRCTFVKWVW